VPFVGPAAEPPASAQFARRHAGRSSRSAASRFAAAAGAPLCRWHLKARGG